MILLLLLGSWILQPYNSPADYLQTASGQYVYQQTVDVQDLQGGDDNMDYQLVGMNAVGRNALEQSSSNAQISW